MKKRIVSLAIALCVLLSLPVTAHAVYVTDDDVIRAVLVVFRRMVMAGQSVGFIIACTVFKKDYFIRTRVVIYCLKGKIHSVLEAIEHEVWPL